MEKDKNGKAKVWVYAVILFTSAFIVLLITAYSQIKFTRNIDNLETQINTKESEKNMFQLNLNSALVENEKLLNENKKLEEQLKKEKETVEAQEKKISEIETNRDEIINSYEKLISAQKEYENKNFTNSAFILLYDVNPEHLKDDGLEKYNELVEKTFPIAAHKLYKDGLDLYKSKQYDEAVEKFNKSLEISENEYFSDDCLYLSAYARYIQGNKQEALSYYRKLLDKYPDSNYAKNSENILKIFEN